MNGLNFQASLSNLTQMDRFQHDAHRSPVINQEQNAQAAREEAMNRIIMPMEPDSVEKKKIDTGQRKRDDGKCKRNRKKEAKNLSSRNSTGNGYILDIKV